MNESRIYSDERSGETSTSIGSAPDSHKTPASGYTRLAVTLSEVRRGRCDDRLRLQPIVEYAGAASHSYCERG